MDKKMTPENINNLIDAISILGVIYIIWST